MKFGLIGVPSSAGAHGPGQEKAPAALRQAGMLGALREAGLEVEDLGDLPVARFAPDRGNRKRQSQSRVVKVARQVADAAAPGDAGLTAPDTTHSGIFDSMGVSHLIGMGDPELAHLGPRFPLVPQDRIALFGFHPYDIEPEEARLLDSSAMVQYPVTSMDDRPVELAAEARARLEGLG